MSDAMAAKKIKSQKSKCNAKLVERTVKSGRCLLEHSRWSWEGSQYWSLWPSNAIFLDKYSTDYLRWSQIVQTDETKNFRQNSRFYTQPNLVISITIQSHPTINTTALHPSIDGLFFFFCCHTNPCLMWSDQGIQYLLFTKLLIPHMIWFRHFIEIWFDNYVLGFNIWPGSNISNTKCGDTTNMGR